MNAITRKNEYDFGTDPEWVKRECSIADSLGQNIKDWKEAGCSTENANTLPGNPRFHDMHNKPAWRPRFHWSWVAYFGLAAALIAVMAF